MRRIALILLLIAGCKRTEDQAARERIFSPEQPVGAAAEAREPIDARKLEGDAKLAQCSSRASTDPSIGGAPTGPTCSASASRRCRAWRRSIGWREASS